MILFSRQPLREAVSWNVFHQCSCFFLLVSLFVRLWVEMILRLEHFPFFQCQPLREAVSWNVTTYPESSATVSQPLREAVSWNVSASTESRYLVTVSLFVRLWVEILVQSPLLFSAPVSLFVRLWVEIWTILLTHPTRHRQPLREAVSWNVYVISKSTVPSSSASSWGCELKYRYNPNIHPADPSASSWGCELKYVRAGGELRWKFVSLFVRLWVEIR